MSEGPDDEVPQNTRLSRNNRYNTEAVMPISNMGARDGEERVAQPTGLVRSALSFVLVRPDQFCAPTTGLCQPQFCALIT